MNKRAILFHLAEAAEQLTKTINSIKTAPEYAFEEYQVEMSHLYHHLNTAWNGRDCTDEEDRAATKFDEWRKFPDNSELFL